MGGRGCFVAVPHRLAPRNDVSGILDGQRQLAWVAPTTKFVLAVPASPSRHCEEPERGRRPTKFVLAVPVSHPRHCEEPVRVAPRRSNPIALPPGLRGLVVTSQ